MGTVVKTVIDLRDGQDNSSGLRADESDLALPVDGDDRNSNRANALYHLRRYDEALASSDKALALNPNDADALTKVVTSTHVPVDETTQPLPATMGDTVGTLTKDVAEHRFPRSQAYRAGLSGAVSVPDPV